MKKKKKTVAKHTLIFSQYYTGQYYMIKFMSLVRIWWINFGW